MAPHQTAISAILAASLVMTVIACETATTLTESEGRYVRCGLELNRPSYVGMSKPGYLTSVKAVTLTADATTLDIQLQGGR